MNAVERSARIIDRWQQRHPMVAFPVAVAKKFADDQAGNLVSLLTYYSFVATFPLLLALTAVVGFALRRFPRLEDKLIRSAFAEFPIVGGQIHNELGVAAFSNTLFGLIVGVVGALIGARGFANALQNTMNTVWAVPKVHRPGFPARYLRTFVLLLLLGLIVLVTGAAGTAAGVATTLGLGGLPAQVVGFAVGITLGFGFFLALFRVAASPKVPTRAMVIGAAISAVAWQLLLNAAEVIVAQQLRHAQAVAGLFGVVLGLLAWLGLQASVIVLAVEADAVRAKRLWPRSLVQPPLTEADMSYYTEAVMRESQRPEQRLDVAYHPDAPPATPVEGLA
jgi:membrane protein